MRTPSLLALALLGLSTLSLLACGPGRLSDADITRFCEVQVPCSGSTQEACEAATRVSRDDANTSGCGGQFGALARCIIRADECAIPTDCADEETRFETCLARPRPDSGSPPSDAGDDPLDAFVPRTPAEDIDLLLLVDNSNSMAEEQGQLLALLPGFIDTLATGDRDGDGTRDFAPVRSLHVGVITPDMGAGPNGSVPTCARGLGDDGILRARSRLTTAPCMATYPSGVLEFASATDDPFAFASTVGCVANVGTGGCGFEQQLEAALKAVTPTSPQAWTREGYVPPLFATPEGVPDTAPGHAEGANAGFLRGDSVLAILFLTDEEDCSVRDYGLFVSSDPRFSSVPLNLRCDTFGDPAMGIVHPVSRYIDGFLGLRRDPSLLVFSAIVGIPPEVEPPPGAPIDFSSILAHPMMIPRANAMGTNLEPSCSTANGVSYPPVRIVQLAAGLDAAGAEVGLTSICTGAFSTALAPIVARIATP